MRVNLSPCQGRMTARCCRRPPCRFAMRRTGNDEHIVKDHAAHQFQKNCANRWRGCLPQPMPVKHLDKPSRGHLDHTGVAADRFKSPEAVDHERNDEMRMQQRRIAAYQSPTATSKAKRKLNMQAADQTLLHSQPVRHRLGKHPLNQASGLASLTAPADSMMVPCCRHPA